MAAIRVEPNPTINYIQCIGNAHTALELEYAYCDNIGDVDDVDEDTKLFMATYAGDSPDIKPYGDSYFDLTGGYSPISTDSGAHCLSPDDIKLEQDFDDDASVILDDGDMAIVFDFVQGKPDISEVSLFERPTPGLNLPLFPMLGLPSDETLAQARKAGSCGDDDGTDIESDSDSEYVPPNRKGCKSVLLWKFLLTYLANSEHGHLLKWENRQRGIFKFVDTVKIAQLWGDQKRKSDMNFEKLSRGIRHYYRSGLMSRVEGRRLVYQFNWKKVPKCYRQKRR